MRAWTSRRARCASLCLLLLLCLGTVRTFEVTLLHTNDNHARIEETSEDSGKCRPGRPCFAGVARRFTKVSEIRKNEENVLFLDAGDQFQGTVWFNYYKGAEAAHFMNKLGYDVMAFGNHEFDNGVEGLIEPFLQKVNCSVVSANIKPDQTLAAKFSGYYRPYALISVGSETVAVVGYTTAETPFLSMPGQHLKFEDEVESLQVQVDKLQTLGYNKIIALGHSGFKVDQDIAKRVRGVDVVIGGHTNTFLYTGSPPSTEVPEGPYPFMVKSNDGRNVPVVQAYAFGKYLGYLKVTFDKAGNIYHNVKDSNEEQWNHVGLCMLNSGAIRTAIDERYKNGIHVEYDISRPVNQRVVSLSMLCTKCRVPKYEPLDPEEVYTVVMPSYIVGGGDGFSMIKDELLKHNTGDMDITVFSRYISEMKRVYPAVEGRITFRNSAVFTTQCLGLLLLSLCLSLTL
ncbi:hypothetical protein INR49_019931 [Caranx melampygus]|nr:hypothetical protein INR49_019931 [Caranx melampygus]